MARTRGAHSVGGESSQQGQRIRPTASARKRAREGDVGVPRGARRRGCISWRSI